MEVTKRMCVLLACCVVAVSNIKSQDIEMLSKVEGGINGFGLACEVPLADKLSIEPALGMGPSYDIGRPGEGLNHNLGWHWRVFEPSLHASVYGKYFYNRSKRIEQGHPTAFNSGNFFGVKLKYVSESLSNRSNSSHSILANINGGGQFCMGEHWSYGYSVGFGFGYGFTRSDFLIYPALELKIGYVLPLFGYCAKK